MALQRDTHDSDLIVPVVYSPEGSITTPFSTAFEISKVAKTIAHDIKRDASARLKPGQILRRSLGSVFEFQVYCEPTVSRNRKQIRGDRGWDESLGIGQD